ncbi:TANGO2 domain-containing protein [Balamuthia mandrillaris]
MCILFFAYGYHPQYPLILLSNRDEDYDRPTALFHFWPPTPPPSSPAGSSSNNNNDESAETEELLLSDEEPDLGEEAEKKGRLLAGKDLLRSGTWLGLTKHGRFATLTNYRVSFDALRLDKKSRGQLITDFLHTNSAGDEWIEQNLLQDKKWDDYDGFNLLVSDHIGQNMYYFSNFQGELKTLEKGKIYGLSNHFLDSPWPKVERGKQLLKQILDQQFTADGCQEEEEAEEQKDKAKLELDLEALLGVLADKTNFPDEELPNTGVGLEWERTLGSIFVQSPDYGTRSSVVVLVDNHGKVSVTERAKQVDAQGLTRPDANFVDSHFTFQVRL